MALKAILDAETYEAADEAVRGYYVQAGDGSYRLDVESVGGWGLEDVAGLKGALQKERAGKGESAKVLAAVKELGGLDVLRSLAEEVETLRSAEPDEKVRLKFEEREKAISSKHAKELSEREANLKAALDELNGAARRDALAKAYAKHKIAPEYHRWLDAELGNQIDVQVSDGKRMAVVIDADGNPRISQAQGSIGNMSVDELVDSLRDNETFAIAFPGHVTEGSGTHGNDRTIARNRGIPDNVVGSARLAMARERQTSRG